MFKYLLQYFLKTGRAVGIFPYIYHETQLKAVKSRALLLYSFCASSVFLFIFPISCRIYFINFQSGFILEKYALMSLVSVFEMIIQIITYTVIVWSLVFKNQNKILETFNCGAELFQVISIKFPIILFFLIVCKIIFFDWIITIVFYASDEKVVSNGVLSTWPMLVTIVGFFIIDLVSNIFFCSLYFSGKLYISLNKELKTIMRSLTIKNPLNLSEMLQISEKIEQKMVLHAKIGKFITNFKQIFSMICVSLVLGCFTTIVGEFYCFYAFSRVPLENNQYKIEMNIYQAFYKIVDLFSFVYASNQITEQFGKTGDILKVFLDSSVDDRLKNSVRFYYCVKVTSKVLIYFRSKFFLCNYLSKMFLLIFVECLS